MNCFLFFFLKLVLYFAVSMPLKKKRKLTNEIILKYKERNGGSGTTEGYL